MDKKELIENLESSNLVYAHAAAALFKDSGTISVGPQASTSELTETYRIRQRYLKKVLSQKDANPELKKLYLAVAEFQINLKKEKPLHCVWISVTSHDNLIYLISAEKPSGRPLACMPMHLNA